jgi:hypothetical protein
VQLPMEDERRVAATAAVGGEGAAAGSFQTTKEGNVRPCK